MENFGFPTAGSSRSAGSSGSSGSTDAGTFGAAGPSYWTAPGSSAWAAPGSSYYAGQSDWTAMSSRYGGRPNPNSDSSDWIPNPSDCDGSFGSNDDSHDVITPNPPGRANPVTWTPGLPYWTPGPRGTATNGSGPSGSTPAGPSSVSLPPGSAASGAGPSGSTSAHLHGSTIAGPSSTATPSGSAGSLGSSAASSHRSTTVGQHGSSGPSGSAGPSRSTDRSRSSRRPSSSTARRSKSKKRSSIPSIEDITRAFYGLDVKPRHNEDSTETEDTPLAMPAPVGPTRQDSPVPEHAEDDGSGSGSGSTARDTDHAVQVASAEDDAETSVSNAVPSSYRAEVIPLSQNCAFHLTNLPPTLTVGGMLDHIHDCGRVYFAAVDDVKESNGQQFRNGKIIFFEAEAGRRFIQRSRRFGFEIHGHTIGVFTHDRRVAEKRILAYVSRVLVIHGDKDIVSPETLVPYLETFMAVDLARGVLHGRSKIRADFSVSELHFPSLSQAARAAQVMHMNLPGQLEVRYGEDPCAVPTTSELNKQILRDLVW